MVLRALKFYEAECPCRTADEDRSDDDDHGAVDTLGANLWEQRKRRKFTDITISCQGIDICAHRCIIAAKSPVFLTMFETQMKESTTGQIEISDVDSVGSVQQMLEFMYTEAVPKD